MLGVWLLATLVASVILWWGALPPAWRRAVALFTSAAGFLFLISALGAEGSREASSTAAFLVGATYVTDQASASASLPYYVLTGVCLLLGTAGLAAGEDGAQRLQHHWFATATGLSLGITALRFCLEKVAAPHAWAMLAGVTWIAPAVGAFFAVNLREEGRGLRSLAGALLAYGFAVRAAVAALMVLASTQGLGSHYDVSMLVRVKNPLSGATLDFIPGSAAQLLYLAVVPQLVFWPVVTAFTGLVGAGLAEGGLALWRRRRAAGPRLGPLRPPVELSGTHTKHPGNGAWTRT